MENLRRLESFVADHQVAYTVVGPSFWGDGMYPPSDAVYYPLYTKCCELELPLCMNTGLPGPPIPGEVQNPIHLDRVCVRFPELRLCMMHGADPWWDVAIRLMIKYANLRLMTSAWSPRHLPAVAAALHVAPAARARVMFASDSPVLSITQVHQGGRGSSTSRPRCSTPTCTRTRRTSSSAADAATDHRSNQVMVETREHDPRAPRARSGRRTSRGSRSTTRSGATRTTRRCVARCARYLDELAIDDDIKVVILRGAGGVFSTGADMANSYAWYGNDPKSRGGPSQRRRLGVDRESFGFYHEFLAYPKVTVAQVETYALGGGFELALMADLAVVGARRQARHARRAAARPRARQPAPLLPPARPGAGPPPAAHRRHRDRRRARAPRRVHRGLRRRTTVAERAEAWAAKVARMPADGLAIAKTSFSLVEQSRRTWARRPAGYLVHAFATNLRFEDDEFNFVKTRAKVGTSEAFKVRDEHFGVDGLR